jgi:tetratricopeptide (TPR) repeat protein
MVREAGARKFSRLKGDSVRAPHQRYLLAGIVSAVFAIPAFADTAGDMKNLLDQHKAAEAYQLGHSHPEELGNAAFDFYYGIACIDAGHASEGVLALERYVLSYPDNPRGRLELARGYFVLGEDSRAREEFENVRKINPPPDVQTAIERFEDAIRTREGRYRTTASFFVEAGMGYDDNVNGGVSDAHISLPGLGPVLVSEGGQRKGDLFYHVAAGGQITHPVAPGVAIFGGLNYDNKINDTDSAYNLESLGGFGGVSILRDKNLYRLSASYDNLSVGYDHYRDVAGLAGEWFHQLDELQGINGYLQYATLRYQGANDVRDADLTGVGVGYRRAFVLPWQPLFSVSLGYGEEHNQRNRPDLGRNFTGVNLGLNLSPTPKWGLNLGYTYQDSHYDGRDFITQTTRDDSYQMLGASATYLVNKSVSVRGDLAVADNSSNLALYSYRRNMASVNVRYEFR